MFVLLIIWVSGLIGVEELKRLSDGEETSLETSYNWSIKFFLTISSDWSKSFKSTSLLGGVLRFFIIFLPKIGDSGDCDSGSKLGFSGSFSSSILANEDLT